MKALICSILVPMLMATQPVIATSSSDAEFAGIWRCEMSGLPAVVITLSTESGKLDGAVLFYLHKRELGKEETATPGVPEPIMNLHVDGQALTFQVSHRRAHPPGTLNDAPVKFKLKITGSNKAVLANESKNDPNAPVHEFTRSDY